MRVVILRVWKEPAVFVGLLVSLALLVLALVSDTPLDANAVIGIAAPFLSSLGIRQFVTPAAGKIQPADKSLEPR
jgi:hypothetical protein